MNKIIYKLYMLLVCPFKGHIEENHLNETKGYITTKRCSKCHSILMKDYTWKISHIHPPNSNDDEILKWEEYCENKYKKLREKCL